MELFHDHGRDDPEAAFQLELLRRRRAKLARSYTRQQQQPQPPLRGDMAATAVVAQLSQESRQQEAGAEGLPPA